MSSQIKGKLMENQLVWFGYQQQRFEEAPVRKDVFVCIEDCKKGRGRPRLIWMEAVRKDMEKLGIKP